MIDKAAGLVLRAAPPDAGAGVAVGTAPDVAVPVVAADPAANRQYGYRRCR